MMPTVSSAAAGLRSTQNTCAPSRAKVTAVALPLPQPGPMEPAPTTIATLPLSRSIASSLYFLLFELPQRLSPRNHALGVGIGRHLDKRTAELGAGMACGARGLERSDDFARLLFLFVGRCQNAIDDGGMGWSQQAFCLEAEPARPARVALKPFDVAPGVGTVDRDHAGGRTFDSKALPAIAELETVGCALRAEIGREIFRRQ